MARILSKRLIMTLAKWNYTNEEWKIFRKWKTRRQGYLPYLLSYLGFPINRKAPEITISDNRVCFDDLHEPFQNSSRRFMEINILEAGLLNVLEISYVYGNRTCGIKVPIPRGKLREAFEVQDRLLLDGASIG